LMAINPRAILDGDQERVNRLATPCDVSFQVDGIRADFQCKAVINTFNEKWIGEFFGAAESHFKDRQPGLLLEFASVLHLSETDFAEFKRWFWLKQSGFEVGQTEEWRPENANEGVRLKFLKRDKPGIARGVEFGASGQYAMPMVIEPPRNILRGRIKDAKRSFGFDPSEVHYNFVVIDLGASSLFDEEDCFRALYGNHSMLHQIERESGHRTSFLGEAFERGSQHHDRSGFFFTENPRWVSGVIIPLRGEANEYAVFPHPDHVESVRSRWIESPFQLGRDLITARDLD